MYCKIHYIRGITILACCDEELLGEKIESSEFSVEIKDSFYNERAVTSEEMKEMMRDAGSINLFGEKCVEVAIEEGFINRSSIIMIGKVPHAQIYRI